MKALKGAVVVLILVLAAAGGIYYYMFLPQPPAIVPTSTSTPVSPTATSTMSTYETSGTRIHKTLGVAPPPLPGSHPYHSGGLPEETLNLTGELRSDGGVYKLAVKALPGYVVALRFASSDLETWAAAHLGQLVTVSGNWDMTNLSFVVESVRVGEGSTAYSNPPVHGTLGTHVSGFWSGTHGTGAVREAAPSAATAGSPAEALPNSFSWDGRFGGPNYMTPVKHQLKCGSCWAFAAVGAMEAEYQINKGRPNTGIDLSEQYALQCTPSSGCEGVQGVCTSSFGCKGNQIDNVLFQLQAGTPDEDCSPYTATDAGCLANVCGNYQSRKYYVTSWSSIGPWPDSIKAALISYGPVIVGMHVFADFADDAGGGVWFQSGVPPTQDWWQSNIYEHDPVAKCTQEERDAGTCPYEGHAVVIVGWDDGNTSDTSDDYWIVRNSWGTGGGDALRGYGGYFYLTQNPARGFPGIYDPGGYVSSGAAAVIFGVTGPTYMVKFGIHPSSSLGTITVTETGNTYSDGQTGDYDVGYYTATANAPADGYRFNYWSTDYGVIVDDAYSNPTTFQVLGNGWGGLSAVYTPRLTFYTNPSNKGSINCGDFSGPWSAPSWTNGQSAWKTELPKYCYNLWAITPPGYTFSGWSCTGGISCPDTASNRTGLMDWVVLEVTPGSVTANFEPLPSVTFYTNPTSFVGNPGTITVKETGTAYSNAETGFFPIGQHTVTANAPVGYQFDHWEFSGLSADGRGVYMADVHSNPTTFQVHFPGTGWLKAVYSAEVTFYTNPPGWGSINWCTPAPEGACTGWTNGQNFFDLPSEHGTMSASANVPPGWNFSEWKCTGGLSCSGTNTETTVDFTGPGSITATFTHPPITVVIQPTTILPPLTFPNSPPTISRDLPLEPDKASPQAVGTTITWTCWASDRDGDPIWYKFWLQLGSGDWVPKQDWSPSNIWSWKPSEAGTYNVGVWVRDGKHADSSGFDDSKAVSYTIKQPVTIVIPTTILPPQTKLLPNSPPTISSLTPGLTPDKASPQVVGTTITWTCSASDPEGDPILYEFWLQSGDGPWVITQEWSYQNWWSWTPGEAGTYKGGVWVRDGKHQGENWFDDSREVPYTIQPIVKSQEPPSPVLLWASWGVILADHNFELSPRLERRLLLTFRPSTPPRSDR